MDQLGRGLAAQWPRAGAGRPVPHARHRGHLHAHRGTGASRRPGPPRRIEAALHIWHEGFVADEIDAYYTHAAVRDTTGQRNRGLLRKSDLAQWRPGYDEPATVQYGRYTVAKCGPWSQGPVHLQQLAILRHLGMDGLDPESPQFVHRIAEAAKLAFADRTAWYGDPAFVEVPLQALLSEPYARTRAALINDTACPDWRPGQPEGRPPCLPDLDAARRTLAASDTRFGVGEPTFAALPPVAEWAERELFVGDTCQIDVIDRHGNMVAATPSGGWLSSSPVVPALGFP